MSGLWLRKDRLVHEGAKTLGASITNEPVSEVFKVTPGGANEAMRVDLVVSDVTASTGITAKLQQKIVDSFSDVATVSITGNGTFTILINARNDSAGYYSLLPLSNLGRVVISTGAGDAVTVDNVYVTMED